MPRHTPTPRPTPAIQQTFDVAGKHAYLIGIGGCGMSGLARMLARRGCIVSGSDISESEATAALASEGFAIGFDQSTPSLPEPCELVIASAAVKPEHPQMVAAVNRGIPTLVYAEALGKCMLGRTGVAIAGTHGKSTTTAMLGTALVDAGLDPTVIVGATCGQLLNGSRGTKSGAGAAAGAFTAWAPSGFRLGSSLIPAGGLAGRPGVLVAEACEYNRSFHSLNPTVACISSVEADHLDCYGTLEAIIESFRYFASLLPSEADGGRLLIGHDNANRREIASGLDCRVETIGFNPSADWVVSYVPGERRVSLTHEGRLVAEWTLRVPGAHNAVNAATALALGTMLGADATQLAQSLSEFRGIDRRSQLLGERAVPGGTVRVYDDYAHHPTEIEVTLKALRELERPEDRGGNLICVFQPHQHSRTRHLLEEFASSFSSADTVVVPHIYFVRDSDEERTKVNSGDLVDRLRSRGVRAMHLYPFEAIVEQLENLCKPGDVVVTMGAGNVYQIARAYLKAGIQTGG